MERGLAIYTLLAFVLADLSAGGSVSVCITNCGQCQLMYGGYFHGQACADYCVAYNGFFFPDCTDPQFVKNFLKRLH